MKVPSLKKIWKTDYPAQYHDLVDQLSTTINSSFETLYNMAARNVSLRDNVFCTVKAVELKVDSNGAPSPALSIPIPQPANIEGLHAIQVVNLTNPTNYSVSGIQVFYSTNSNGITINNVKGLRVGDNYSIKLVIYQF
jgi:hypothetical protein